MTSVPPDDLDEEVVIERGDLIREPEVDLLGGIFDHVRRATLARSGRTFVTLLPLDWRFIQRRLGAESRPLAADVAKIGW